MDSDIVIGGMREVVVTAIMGIELKREKYSLP
jgi:hypothetical protein